mgnify:FL=1
MAKTPRRTAERILTVALDLFNRLGEPNVSTTALAQELGISAGNLYYHYPAKAELINALVQRYQQSMQELLSAAPAVRHVEDAWFFVHLLFERIWQYRFLYRDLNNLLSNNRELEHTFQAMLKDKAVAMQSLLGGLTGASSSEGAASSGDEVQHQAVAQAMVVVLTFWLNYEFALNPRQALEPEQAGEALARGVHHALSLLMPYLDERSKLSLRAITDQHLPPITEKTP